MAAWMSLSLHSMQVPFAGMARMPVMAFFNKTLLPCFMRGAQALASAIFGAPARPEA